MPFNTTGFKTQLENAFVANFDDETDAAAAIAAAISAYFQDVAMPAPGEALADAMTNSAQLALSGMSGTDPESGAGLFAEKLSAAVMAAASEIKNAESAIPLSPVISAPTYTFSNGTPAAPTTASQAAADIATQTNTATSTWKYTPPSSSPTSWT